MAREVAAETAAVMEVELKEDRLVWSALSPSENTYRFDGWIGNISRAPHGVNPGVGSVPVKIGVAREATHGAAQPDNALAWISGLLALAGIGITAIWAFCAARIAPAGTLTTISGKTSPMYFIPQK
ncbi:hypothetical protein [Nitrobacter sp. JJSN]|uniref:hypothetical protein n=1 Tax=Nitrobacter sp. JJSN TaxID=3453033 RepID=UPI003F758FE1